MAKAQHTEKDFIVSEKNNFQVKSRQVTMLVKSDYKPTSFKASETPNYSSE